MTVYNRDSVVIRVATRHVASLSIEHIRRVATLSHTYYDKFLREFGSGDFKFVALFSSKKPGSRPKKALAVPSSFNSARALEERIQEMASSIDAIGFEDGMIWISFTGNISNKPETYAFTKVPYSEWYSEKTGKSIPAPKKKVVEIRAEIMQTIKDLGLRELHGRYGKSGEMFGVEGGARELAVGNKEMMLNVLLVEMHYGRQTSRWVNKKIELISKMGDPRNRAILENWVKWVKAGPTMKEIRQKAREDMKSVYGG